MIDSLKWIREADGTPWSTLTIAVRAGLPVPNGFVVFPSAAEIDTRIAHEELKVREKTHFLVIRGPSHAVVNVIGSDQLIHTLRRLWAESPDTPLFIQRMVHSTWCGKAHWHRKNLRIHVNEGMMILDPDTYLFNTSTGKCIRKIFAPIQRKMVRHVDGTTKTVQQEGERTPMASEQLKSVVELAERAGADVGWAIDDRERTWLISVE